MMTERRIKIILKWKKKFEDTFFPKSRIVPGEPTFLNKFVTNDA